MECSARTTSWDLEDEKEEHAKVTRPECLVRMKNREVSVAGVLSRRAVRWDRREGG